MLLIYTHKITNRFTYVTRHIFVNLLGIDVTYSTKVEDFIKHQGPKITYTKKPLQNEFFIQSNGLLTELGIREVDIEMGKWEEIPCFFRTGHESTIPFDLFAASFFLLTRYEEYWPYSADKQGRFPAEKSIALKHGFMHKPLIDLWALRLQEQLKRRFPALKGKSPNYRFTSVIDVTTSHAYANRGPIRSIGGMLIDLGRFRIKRIFERLAVLGNLKRDPFDNFSHILALHRKVSVDSIFFFQFADYSTHDKNVSTESAKFRHLIKSVADYTKVSLATSYAAHDDLEKLKLEKKRLSKVINRPIDSSRMRYNWVDIPVSYRNLTEAEFKADYSMGYTHQMGFKASTCSPFYFYDINAETQQPILVYPFAMHDYALRSIRMKETMMEEVVQLYQVVKAVNGHFITVFSNEHLGGSHRVDWLDLYQSIITRVNV